MAPRCLRFLAAGLMAVEGGRVSRRSSGAQGAKFIAGVPVLNYHPHDSLSQIDAAGEEDDWIVVVEPSTTDAQIDALCKRAKYGLCVMTGHPSGGGVPFIEVRGTEAELKVVLEGANGVAKFVEPNPRMNMIPDDDAEFGQAGESELEAASDLWHLKAIGVPQADRTGKGVHVYVFDTGVRVTHQDFQGRAVATLDVVASPNAPQECKGDTSCAGDVRGHGTHCAGTAAGNQYGVAKEATVHAVKVLSDTGAGPWSYIIGGLDWVSRKRVRPAVASLSLGGPGVESSMGTAVDVAVGAGVTIVVAAGNHGGDSCTYTPAYAPNAISVGGLTVYNSVAYFSGHGSCVNIWAPGMNIKSLDPGSDTKTGDKSGTSQACPQVAGGAALILEANPSLSVADVRAALMSNARDDIIPKMKDGDTNKLLYVGDVPMPPTPAPSRRRFFR